MKKTSFALAVTALAISVLTLSGCGMFRSHKQWDRAQQEAPLEIPPGLDSPSTSAALVIPEPGTGAQGASAVNDAAQPVTDGFVVKDDVDTAYRRIGEMLGAGDLGQVVNHDDTAHTYELAVAKAAVVKSQGFFKRMFSSNSSADKAGGKDSPAATRSLTLAITSSGSGSEVRAQGDDASVRKVIDALKSRLGG